MRDKKIKDIVAGKRSISVFYAQEKGWDTE